MSGLRSGAVDPATPSQYFKLTATLRIASLHFGRALIVAGPGLVQAQVARTCISVQALSGFAAHMSKTYN